MSSPAWFHFMLSYFPQQPRNNDEISIVLALRKLL